VTVPFPPTFTSPTTVKLSVSVSTRRLVAEMVPVVVRPPVVIASVVVAPCVVTCWRLETPAVLLRRPPSPMNKLAESVPAVVLMVG